MRAMIQKTSFPKLPARSARLSVICVALLLTCSVAAWSQQASWSRRMSASTIQHWPNGRFVGPGQKWAWNYELGVLLNGMDAAWYNSADGDDYHYIQNAVDQLVAPDGSIPTYSSAEHSLDNIALGPSLLLLYRVTQNKKYYKAATLLRHQLSEQPRNASGGFWHKQRYPNQMWLDGLYMAEPF